MKLTEEQKQTIEAEYREFEANQYAGKSKAERQKKGQFFTPPVLTIKMLEKFDDMTGPILDPTCGAGGLLVACILAGADPQSIYGIELDSDIAEVCRKRLAKYGVPANHIKVGNALDSDAYIFNDVLKPVNHDQDAVFIDLIKIEDSLIFEIEILKFPNISIRCKKSIIIVKNKKFNKANILKIHNIIKKLVDLNYWFISEHSIQNIENTLNKIYTKINIENISMPLKFQMEKNKLFQADKLKFNSFDDFQKLYHI